LHSEWYLNHLIHLKSILRIARATTRKGGEGVLWEVVETILKEEGIFEETLEEYLRGLQ
jgi:3-deoxy-D-manno-octulosonate 8-phosphate phosphatase KdsC-like HAD superfamily phosphatase